MNPGYLDILDLLWSASGPQHLSGPSWTEEGMLST